jgi:hypothetical protein
VAITTGAGCDFAGAASGLLALLPLAGLGAGFPDGSESDESSLADPDFGPAFAPEFGPGLAPEFGDDARFADFIALSHAGWKDSPVSLLCCPTRAARGSGADDAYTPLDGIDIRTRTGNARRAPKRSC